MGFFGKIDDKVFWEKTTKFLAGLMGTHAYVLYRVLSHSDVPPLVDVFGVAGSYKIGTALYSSASFVLSSLGSLVHSPLQEDSLSSVSEEGPVSLERITSSQQISHWVQTDLAAPDYTFFPLFLNGFTSYHFSNDFHGNEGAYVGDDDDICDADLDLPDADTLQHSDDPDSEQSNRRSFGRPSTERGYLFLDETSMFVLDLDEILNEIDNGGIYEKKWSSDFRIELPSTSNPISSCQGLRISPNYFGLYDLGSPQETCDITHSKTLTGYHVIHSDTFSNFDELVKKLKGLSEFQRIYFEEKYLSPQAVKRLELTQN